MIKAFFIFFIASILLVSASCMQNNDAVSQKNIYETMVDLLQTDVNFRATNMFNVIQKHNLQGLLSTQSNLTFFVPVDTCPYSSASDDIAFPYYHISTERFDNNALKKNFAVSTLLIGDGSDSQYGPTNLPAGVSQKLLIVSDPGTEYKFTLNHGSLGNANILRKFVCTNGDIYLIDSILSYPIRLDTYAWDNKLGHFINALNRAQLLDSFMNEKGSTFFIPSNDVVSADYFADVSVLNSHRMRPNVTYSNGFIDGQVFMSAGGFALKATVDASGALFVNDKKVINADIPVRNGVVHVISEPFDMASLTHSNQTFAGLPPPIIFNNTGVVIIENQAGSNTTNPEEPKNSAQTSFSFFSAVFSLTVVSSVLFNFV